MSTACECCGQSWETPPTLAVACPKCGQAPGSPCVSRAPSGHVKEAAFAGLHPWGHVEREAEALRLGIIRKCTSGKTARAAREPRQAELFA